LAKGWVGEAMMASSSVRHQLFAFAVPLALVARSLRGK